MQKHSPSQQNGFKSKDKKKKKPGKKTINLNLKNGQT